MKKGLPFLAMPFYNGALLCVCENSPFFSVQVTCYTVLSLIIIGFLFFWEKNWLLFL